MSDEENQPKLTNQTNLTNTELTNQPKPRKEGFIGEQPIIHLSPDEWKEYWSGDNFWYYYN